MKYELNVKGRFFEIITHDYEFLVPISVVNSLTEITNDINDSIELISYIKERSASYNETIETKMHNSLYYNNENIKKFSCSIIFIEGLYTMLLSNNFVPEQIINCLDSISDHQLFGECDTECKEEVLDRILKINKIVRNMIINNESSRLIEDDAFSYIKRKKYE